ncbi:hypothetical protein UA08_05859 [Talaromyces atroroseus]|uniref:Uncharacterized protein n=1 Tax=Talaromyces atroroseus TaxID=1441469 RepID=A0A225AZA4_TALAT|nr:hypothetical protein UA08_05859 [Talaromyces atroroseus]OKL58847.1 hypothetical protein UA08_05859 [Talaromyces atroroseus]
MAQNFSPIPVEMHATSLTIQLASIEEEKLNTQAPNRDGFDNPLSHFKTNSDCLVKFDGLDDTYRPVNWKVHQKFCYNANKRIYGRGLDEFSVPTHNFEVVDRFYIG